MAQPTYSELYSEFEGLKEKCISQIKTLVGRKKRIEFSDNNVFEDESFNELVAVDKNEVFFENGESYDLNDLGITDALQIIHILEEQSL